MAHNVKIRYYARENKKVGTHSFFAQPIPNGTYGFEQLCEQASKNTTIEAHTIRAAVEEYMKVAREKLLDGFRVEIGAQFVTLYPNLQVNIKDYQDEKTGRTVVVTAKDLNALGAKSRVGATVNAEFSHQFAANVSWQKTDKSGAPVEDEDDATVSNEEQAQSPSGDNGTQGNPGGGSTADGDDQN